MKEEYIIRFNYLKPDGYWVYSAEEYVLVTVLEDMEEKCNHDLAKQIFYTICKSRYKEFEITLVEYV